MLLLTLNTVFTKNKFTPSQINGNEKIQAITKKRIKIYLIYLNLLTFSYKAM